MLRLNSQTFSPQRFLLRSAVKSSEPSTRFEQGATLNTANAGVFDLDVDSNGRWSIEKFKGLIFQIERDANQIAQRTRRGKGNMILAPQTLHQHLPTQVFLTTPLHSTQTSTLTMLVTPSQVFSTVVTEYTLTHMLLITARINTTLLVIRVHHLMTQVCSIAHTYLSRWSVQLVRTPSSPRLASRLVTALLQTPSQKEPMLVLAVSSATPTVTTEESRLQTSCDSFSRFSQRSFGTSFFMPK